MATNAWFRFRYTLQAPLYDRITKFHAERRRSIATLRLEPGERVLVIGAGTGADLPFLPDDVRVLAIDLTPAMLEQARERAGPAVELRVMDAHRLELPGDSVDAAILHMVLEVFRNPARCLAEAARVLRPGGRIAVFDKFLPEGERPGLLHRAALALLDVVFTSTNRRLGDILAAAGAPLVVERDEPARGPYRHVLLRKPASAQGYLARPGME
ncbi:MAG TPA: methyltransferase domain-containing protein [Thermoanaerobaculia bacterium]|nr:methyltransferase domain-containing protein [Thermoanaerobaculia bacterium]